MFVASGECRPETSSTCQGLGNPTNIQSLSKEENSTDWISPREPRFKIDRFYNSNPDSYKELNYPDAIKGLMTVGGVWRSGFDVFISDYGTSELTLRNANGKIIPLPAVNSVSETKAGSPYKVVNPNSIYPYYWLEDGSGKRMKFQRFPYRATLALVQTDWPDGYSIFVDRDSTNFSVNVVRDNKGNRAVFTPTLITAGNANVVVASSVKIDTNYPAFPKWRVV